MDNNNEVPNFLANIKQGIAANIIKGTFPGGVAEGTIHTWKDGSQWKKQGGAWVGVKNAKSGKKEEESKGKTPTAAAPAAGKDGQTEQASKHDLAQLTHMKEVMHADPAKAYEIFQSLEPAAQHMVPQDVVNTLVKQSHDEGSTSKEGASFDDLGKKGDKPVERKKVGESISKTGKEAKKAMAQTTAGKADAAKKEGSIKTMKAFENLAKTAKDAKDLMSKVENSRDMPMSVMVKFLGTYGGKGVSTEEVFENFMDKHGKQGPAKKEPAKKEPAKKEPTTAKEHLAEHEAWAKEGSNPTAKSRGMTMTEIGEEASSSYRNYESAKHKEEAKKLGEAVPTMKTFEDVAKTATDAKDFMAKVREIKNVPDSVSRQFFSEYGEEKGGPFISIEDAAKKFMDKHGKKAAPKKAAPKKLARQGNSKVNVAAHKILTDGGVDAKKLGKAKYEKVMTQIAHEALVDSNFSTEARLVLAAATGDKKLAEKPDYPNPSDPKFKEKKAQIKKDRASASEYENLDSNHGKIARDITEKAGWSGDDAIDAIAFHLKLAGSHKLAETLQGIMDSTIEKGLKVSNLYNEAEVVVLMKGGKGLPIGTKRTHGGVDVIKTAQGWKFDGSGKSPAKKGDEDKGTGGKKSDLDRITNHMNILEKEIKGQQEYIKKHGKANDASPDKQWNEYKEDAKYNLSKWDAMKKKRDSLKAAPKKKTFGEAWDEADKDQAEKNKKLNADKDKVVARTSSGKAVYGDASHKGHSKFTKKDHNEAAKHHVRKIVDITDAWEKTEEGKTANFYNPPAEEEYHYKQADAHAKAGGTHGSTRHLIDEKDARKDTAAALPALKKKFTSVGKNDDGYYVRGAGADFEHVKKSAKENLGIELTKVKTKSLKDGNGHFFTAKQGPKPEAKVSNNIGAAGVSLTNKEERKKHIVGKINSREVGGVVAVSGAGNGFSGAVKIVSKNGDSYTGYRVADLAYRSTSPEWKAKNNMQTFKKEHIGPMISASVQARESASKYMSRFETIDDFSQTGDGKDSMIKKALDILGVK